MSKVFLKIKWHNKYTAVQPYYLYDSPSNMNSKVIESLFAEIELSILKYTITDKLWTNINESEN